MPLSKTEFILCQFRFFTNFNMLTRQVAEVHGCNDTFGNGAAHDEYMMNWVGTHKVSVTMTVIIINSPSTISENKVIATAVVTVLAGWVFTSGIGVIIIIIIFIIIIMIIVIMIICCSVLSS